MSSPSDIIVIGAGSAGLTAGLELHKNYPNANLQIFEAGSIYGGRVRANSDWADYPIEVGAEFLHSYNSWYGEKLRGISGIQYTNDEDKDTYFQHVDTDLITALEDSDTSLRVLANLEAIYEFYYEKVDDPSIQDMSIAQVLEQSFTGADEGTEYMYESGMGSEFGTTIDRLSAYGYTKTYEEYKDYYVPKDYNENKEDIDYQMKGKTQYEIFGEIFEDIIPFIEYNTPIKKINYSGDQVVITTQSDVEHTADKVVICVPITQLKDNKLIFEPALSQEKQDAIDAIQMDPGVKVHLKFSEKFWDDDSMNIVLNGSLKTFWDSSSARSDTEYVLAGMIFGDLAVDFETNKNDLINEALENFGLAYDRDIASLFEDSLIQDWGEEAYIEGGYSSPGLNEGDARKTLRVPIDNKVYFAGEHTHPYDFQSVHGAMESGLWAVGEITGKHYNINNEPDNSIILKPFFLPIYIFILIVYILK